MQSAHVVRTKDVNIDPRHTQSTWSDILRAYLALTKPGIVLWLMITALCAMTVAAHGVPPLITSGATLLGLAFSAGGAHAVNMWYDRDIDQVMERTKHRPVAVGRIPPVNALVFGVAAGVFSFFWLFSMVNLLTALTCLSGYLFYVFVYTIWLKRRSPQNIVIGGAAGAVPPLVGWTAITEHLGVTAWLMFLIVFLWTPPHFWTLALYKQDDYRRAKIPMMPIVRGSRATTVQTMVYTVLVIITSVALYRVGHLNWGYLLVAIIAGTVFLGYQVQLFRNQNADNRSAKRAFEFSLIYIALLFAAMTL
ncbi:MAG: heme o synthase [Firmicutes bacterium]|nr:heme o synthase [Bacillota bacterium]